MSKKKRRFTSEQKLELLKKHHVGKVPISDVCDSSEVQPSLFYNWQSRLFANGAAALDDRRSGNVENAKEKALLDRIAQLESRLAKKDEVIAEISEEFVKLKKTLGEP